LIKMGDHPGLALVNSRALPNRRLVELIGDGDDYVRFLLDASLIDEEDATAIGSAFSAAEVDAAAAHARLVREQLRPAVAQWSEGLGLERSPALRDALNDLLAPDSRYDRIDEDGRLARGRRRWDDPRQLLVPPIAALAQLLATGDRGLVRKCEDDLCTLWFYDHTKAHRRRWCSMAICGNRNKARAHRERAAAPHETATPRRRP
jgi:predicted RNA-binding Zn ribbon-like protein